MKKNGLSGILICVVLSMVIMFAFTGCNPDTPEPTTGTLTVKTSDKMPVGIDYDKYIVTVLGGTTSKTVEFGKDDAIDFEVAPGTYEVVVEVKKGDDIVGRGTSSVKVGAVGKTEECPIDLRGVLYVSDNGNDGNDGSKGTPYKTVAKALENSGIPTTIGTIYLLSDTTENIEITKPISLIGQGKAITTISGNIVLKDLASSQKVVLENLAVVKTETASPTGVGGSGNYGVINVQSAVNLTVENCTIKHTNQDSTKGFWATGIRMEGENAKVSVIDTDIDALYYGIGVRNKGQKLSVQGSTLTGWAAIMTSAGGLTDHETTGTSISVNDSTLIGKTLTKGDDNYYGAVVLQEKYNGVTLSISNSTIKAIAGAETAEQTVCLEIRSYGNTVTVDHTAMIAESAVNEGTNGIVGGSVIRLGWAELTKPRHSETDDSAHVNNTINITDCTINKKGAEKAVISARAENLREYDELKRDGNDWLAEDIYLYPPASPTN